MTRSRTVPAVRSWLMTLCGLGVTRYVMHLEPLASADVDTVVAMVAPTLQRYLTGPLDEQPSGNGSTPDG